MVGDLLDVSRMEAGTLRYEFVPVSLQDLLESLLQVHSSLRSAHLVHAEVPNDLPKVLADRDRLSQVFLNLLSNASRYSPEGTNIKVTVEHLPQESVVRVGVQDEGIGIAQGDADRIFEKFAMLPKPVWVKKGTGLGLFITKGIVEAHRGRIWIESEVGKGSTFLFTLPTAGDAA
jgi:signal transduction histidine kinase